MESPKFGCTFAELNFKNFIVMRSNVYHIKIAGAGTRKDIVQALRMLAEDIDNTPTENLGTTRTEFEDNTVTAEIIVRDEK